MRRAGPGPFLQSKDWLLPIPGTRETCEVLGRHERLRLEAELGDLADATTHWLLFYGFGAAALMGGTTWLVARSRAARGGAGPGADTVRRRVRNVQA